MLVAIGVFKLIKCALLIAAAVGLFKLAGKDASGTVRAWLADLGLDPRNGSLSAMLGKLDGYSIGKMEALSAGAIVYAALFAVEGAGLLSGKRWAEYLTIVITLSFIPFELYELAHEVSAMKVVTLVVNVAIAAYLVMRVRQE
ncbi:MAG TPA: DUF2127 domain-containing protein [Kofleriaceae bacterium]